MPYAIIACSITFFWVISLRAYIFTILPTMAADLGLSPSAAGALIGVTALGYCVAMWSAGFLPGRHKQIILAGIAASLLAMTAIALIPGPAALYAATMVAGAGSGVYLPLGLAIIVGASEPARRSRNMSIHEVMATGGYFCGAGFVAVALPYLTWQQATLAWSVVGIAACLAMLFLRDEPVVRRRTGEGTRVRLDATLGASIAVFATCQILLSGLTSVLPLIMVEGWAVGQVEAAAVVSWSRLAGLLGIAIAGVFGDRWPLAANVRGFFALAAISTASLAVLPYGPLFVAAVFSLSAAASGVIVLVSVVVAQAFPVEARARALSVSNGSSGIIALAVLPALFGYFVEREMLAAPFVVATLGSLLAAALIGYLTRRQVAATEI